jgi:hypothetical protein
MAEPSRQRRPSPKASSESPLPPIAASTVISRSEKKSERLARYLIDQCKQLEPGTLLASEASMAEAFGVVRAENLIRGCDQQSCSPYRPAVMITDHVPTVRLPPDYADGIVAAAVPA